MRSSERPYRLRYRSWLRAGLLAATLGVVSGCSFVADLLPDTTPPTVTITSPTDGSTTSSSTVIVLATVTDDREVASVTASANGGSSVACDSIGGDQYACGPLGLSLGSNLVAVQAVDGAGNASTASAALSFTSAGSEFDIVVEFYDATFTASQRAAFTEAATVWSSLVVGDVADTFVDLAADACGIPHPSVFQSVDDLLILATTYSPSSPDILGSAGPCLSRIESATPGGKTTVLGLMRFNEVRIDELEASGQLVDTIVHEMGHVLGIGTNWSGAFGFDLLEFTTSDGSTVCRDAAGFSVPPRYTGAAGRSAWFSLGGFGDVPVEESGGPGTQCGHWDEETFGSELMTGIIDPGTNPLSRLSAESLEDINYVVDSTLADPYSLPTSLSTTGAGLDIAAQEVLIFPVGAIDPDTGEIVRLD
jgi:hypothetical protein